MDLMSVRFVTFTSPPTDRNDGTASSDASVVEASTTPKSDDRFTMPRGTVWRFHVPLLRTFASPHAFLHLPGARTVACPPPSLAIVLRSIAIRARVHVLRPPLRRRRSLRLQGTPPAPPQTRPHSLCSTQQDGWDSDDAWRPVGGSLSNGEGSFQPFGSGPEGGRVQSEGRNRKRPFVSEPQRVEERNRRLKIGSSPVRIEMFGKDIDREGDRILPGPGWRYEQHVTDDDLRKDQHVRGRRVPNETGMRRTASRLRVPDACLKEEGREWEQRVRAKAHAGRTEASAGTIIQIRIRACREPSRCPLRPVPWCHTSLPKRSANQGKSHP